MTARVHLFSAATMFAWLCAAGCSNEAGTGQGNLVKIQVTSTAFAESQPIPQKYTGDGDDISPPLHWNGAPPQTKSFALVCEDPDAPMGTFTHWVIYDVPSKAAALSVNIAKTGTLPDGSRQGQNGFNNIGYNGPSPPPGQTHRYFFKVYALDTNLDLDPGTSKGELLNAMNGHVIAEGELMGTYQQK
jgi:Raf kinase inhibitor-like YbhB/YbcL family protein